VNRKSGKRASFTAGKKAKMVSNFSSGICLNGNYESEESALLLLWLAISEMVTK